MATLLKLGGELLDDATAVRTAAEAIVRLASATPVVVVHGGGRAIDAEIRARGNTPSFVDGLRITDQVALDAVVSVLAGRTNTTLVAAIGAAGGRAIGSRRKTARSRASAVSPSTSAWSVSLMAPTRRCWSICSGLAASR
jgi:acetylglutamate kinase